MDKLAKPPITWTILSMRIVFGATKTADRKAWRTAPNQAHVTGNVD